MAQTQGNRESLIWGAAEPPNDDGLRPLARLAPAPDAFDPRQDYVVARVLSHPPARPTGGLAGAAPSFPAIHARLSAGIPGHEDLDRRSFVAPRLLGQYASDRLNRVLRRDLLKLGPVPFRNDLHLSLALFSVRSEERLSGALGILNQLAENAAQPYTSQALPFAKALGDALNLALGFDDGLRTEVGLSQNIAADAGEGVFVVAYNRGASYSLDRLALRADDDVLVDRKTGKPFPGAHIVYSVDAVRGRSDWAQIPELKEAWSEVRAAARSGAGTSGFIEAIRRFQRVAFASEDLVEADARRIAEKAETFAGEVTASFEAADGGGLADPGPLEGALSDTQAPGQVAVETDAQADSPQEEADTFRRAAEYPKPFRDAMSFVFGEEAGFIGEDHDFEGPTALPVGQDAYNAWRDSIALPRQHTSKMRHAEAVGHYYETLWLGAACDRYDNADLALAMFDTCVLFGPARTKRFLQLALTRHADQPVNARFLRRFIDGYVGPRTLDTLRLATQGEAGVKPLIGAILSLRAGYHRARVIQEVKGRHQGEHLIGWMDRLARLHHKTTGEKPAPGAYSVAGPAGEPAPAMATALTA